jgi:hypothetical protein
MVGASLPECIGDTGVGIGLRVTSDARPGLVDKGKGLTSRTPTARRSDELPPDTLCEIAINARALSIYTASAIIQHLAGGAS